jgi:hypothetical protein
LTHRIFLIVVLRMSSHPYERGELTMRGDHYKEIYLETTSHALAITPQAYEQIVAIAQAHRICTYCFEGYTQENPQVAENVCLRCFLKRRTNTPTNLIFVGQVPSEYAQRYGYQVYKFVDPHGYVYITHSHNKLNDKIEQDIRATLMHYGFRVPERYTLKSGTEVDLNTYSWHSIYGDFQTSPVVIATYHEYYGDHIDAAFVLYHDRDPLEFSKRKNPTRQWYLETKAELVATYKPQQGYIVGTGLDGGDRTAYQLYDHHFYPGIVARARSAYEQENKQSQ